MTRSRLFVSSPDQPRARRAGDLVMLVVGLVLLALVGIVAVEATRIEDSLGDVVSALPSWTQELFAIGYSLAAVYAAWLLVMAALRRRWDIVVYLGLALILAIGAGFGLAWLITGSWPIVLPEFGDATAVARFPVIRVAAVTAMVFTAGPHITRSIRWLGWIVVGLVIISGLGLGLGLPSDAVGGVGIGIVAAGTVLLLLGSPAGYPNVEEISTQLLTLDIDLRDLGVAPIQTWGARTLLGVDVGGRRLVVKVYGSDARDAQMFTRTWRYLWYRDTGPSLPWSRLQQVEHEALVTVLARSAGVNCPDVIVAATSEDGDAILVTEQRGVPLSDLPPDAITDALLAGVWREVGTLHEATMSHGALDTTNITVEDGRPVITDFQAGSLSATRARIGMDMAELLVSTAVIVGVDRAVRAARDGVGDVTLGMAVPYLQPPALRPSTRRTVDKPGRFVKEIRTAVVESTGVEEPEPVKLHRVGLKDIVVTLLIVLLAAFLLRQLADIDIQEVWASLQDAEWGWVLAALVVAQLILIPNATSLMSVVRAPLPLRPTIILQSAIQFVGVAVPSAAGRIATNIAYLTKFGLSPAVAVTQGALDSFTTFIVQVVILGVAFLFGDVNFGFGSPTSDGADWGLILLIAVAVVVIGVIVVMSVKKLRVRVLETLHDVRGALSVLIEEPKRAVVLFTSNFVSQLVLAMAMWFSVVAIGEEIGLGAALAVVVGAVLLGGLAPTPGGVGVQEAVLAAGLVGVGLSSNDAAAAAIIYRIVTFALPPFWGAASLAWLRRNDYV